MPVELASTAARLRRLAPPTLVNDPPRYAVDPTMSIARTFPETFGFHGRSAPVAASNAATRFRVVEVPPEPAGRTLVNEPPMYTVPFATVIVYTRPFA